MSKTGKSWGQQFLISYEYRNNGRYLFPFSCHQGTQPSQVLRLCVTLSSHKLGIALGLKLALHACVLNEWVNKGSSNSTG